MRIGHTEIIVVLDKSGSMSLTAADTIGGFNTFVQDQQKVPGTASLTLHTFDTQVHTPYADSDIQKAPLLSNNNYVPGGMTAMNDAIGLAIKTAGERLSKSPAEHVVMVIMTDGAENSSKEYTTGQIREMIKHQTETYNWQFVFLGANINAEQTGQTIGARVCNSMQFSQDAQGISASYAATTENLTSMRMGQKRDMSYSAEQKSAANKQ